MEPAAPLADDEAGPSLEGEVLDGRYHVGARLGAGGMATVYVAADARLPRTVVVKVPHPSLLVAPGFRKRFEKEIAHLTTLDHPHVVKIHDTGEVRGMPYAVMQHLPGGSLIDRMKEAGGKIEPKAILDWLPDIAEALDFIHSHGMVHRDVKPDNILFDKAGHAFVSDFGVAKAASALETKITRTGMIAGSPAYMAPEVVRGMEAGPAFDQYSLGIVVYEALSGRLPHEGSTPLSILTKRAYETATALAPLRPDVPLGVVVAVMRALEREPGRRFASCAEFARAFERGVAGEIPEAMPPDADPPLPAAGEGPARRTREATFSGADAKRSRMLVGVAAGGALLAVAAAVFAVLGPGGGARPAAGPGRPAGPPSAAGPAEPEPPPPSRATGDTPWKLTTPPGAPEWVRISDEQIACAERHKVPAWFENDLGMRFVLIPAGRFLMGSPPEENGHFEEEVAHPVTISRAFYLQTTEATNRQFRRFRPGHHCEEFQGLTMDGDDQPAAALLHADAVAFVRWLGEREPGRTCRLPTEAEWEYACRAATQGRYFWGDDDAEAGRYANLADRTARRSWKEIAVIASDDGQAASSPAGSYLPNPWGLQDTIGNVGEWCADWYGPYSTVPAVDPSGPASGGVHVVRGGGFYAHPRLTRAANRLGAGLRPDATYVDFGFRVACDLPAAPPSPPAVLAPTAAIVEPVDGAALAEGAVFVRGSGTGVTADSVLLVNGVRVTPKGEAFEATITLPPGDQEIEVLCDGKPLALRKVTVTAAPRPALPEVPEWAKVSAQQVAEARRLGVPVAFESPLGMRFVLIPAGRFAMGARPADPYPGEGARPVTLTHPFYLATTEVTSAQYRRFKPEHAVPPFRGMAVDGDAMPVTSMASKGADAFAAWACLQDPSRGYRLPTEAEWEYACRAGTEGVNWWGDSVADVGKFGNVSDRAAMAKWPGWKGIETDDGVAGPAPVGSYPASPWGLFDMIGNAAEVVSDLHEQYPVGVRVDPTGAAAGPDRVIRGGSWGSLPEAFEASSRGWGEGGGAVFVGFRLAADVPASGTRPSAAPVPAAPAVVLAEPAEGAALAEGAVAVKGTAAGLPKDAILRVNGVAMEVEGGAFAGTITLPPGDQGIELLMGAESLALRSMKVTASPRPAPPEVPEWAKVSAQQVAEAKRLGVPVAFENPLGMRFVLIPAGRFLMGSPPGEPDRQEQESLHPVCLSRAFYVQATEVTNAQFRRWKERHLSGAVGTQSLNDPEQPAGNVPWAEAAGFCDWLATQQTGRTFRLPTEAEWEYACRAGTAGRFSWGEDETQAGKFANTADRTAGKSYAAWKVLDTEDGFLISSPVGTFAPNAWGLHDMLGNVWEWCADGVRVYPLDAECDPVGPSHGDSRCLRGSSWCGMPAGTRAAYRGNMAGDTRDMSYGFRVVCDLPEKK